jgi:magnesium-protoporphyrin IX monomethyl ester (oxidative) cyclase
MRVLLVHPSRLMISEVFVCLEPIGLERIGAAAVAAGHEVRILDLQIFSHRDYFRELESFRPHAVGFSVNYLANVPEVIDLAKATKQARKDCFVFVGGHSVSFVAQDVLRHGEGAIDCVMRGEGELAVAPLLEAIGDQHLEKVPGAITLNGAGPAPILMTDLDQFLPARHLTRNRKRYFIGELDPCGSVEFTRGCPWDCSFCSAWTFYGRSYRKSSPEVIAEDIASIKEPGVFIVDDVSFVHPEHGFAIGAQLEKRKVKKNYYLETRADVLCRNREVFAYWKKLGLTYMFIGLESIDEETLKAHRKRSKSATNIEALEVARQLDIPVAINLIAEPDWDERKFEIVRQWALEVPEMVHLTVSTPYPGTETWLSCASKLTTLDYRLFDIQHAVMPTRLPLKKFYEELVKTQSVLGTHHMAFGAMRGAASIALRLLLRGQTNFIKMMWKFNKVYNAERQYAEHFKEVKYQMTAPPAVVRSAKAAGAGLYVHMPREGTVDASAAARSRAMP